MLVKKIIFSFLGIVCFIALSMGSTGYCSVNLPRIAFDRVAIGGIQPFFATKDYVRSIYGEPDEIKELKESKAHGYGRDEVWKYGDTFTIYFYKDSVDLVISSGPNGLKTPDGIAVGDSEAKLISAYGGKGKIGYWYKSDYDANFVFGVKDGKVSYIAAGWNL